MGSFDVSPNLSEEFDDFLAATRAALEAEALEDCMAPAASASLRAASRAGSAEPKTAAPRPWSGR